MSFLKPVIRKLEQTKEGLEKFRDNQKAEVGKLMISGIIAIVAIVVIAILGSALLPDAISTIVDTNTSTWGAGAVAIWSAISIFVVLAFLLIVLAIALYILKSVDS